MGGFRSHISGIRKQQGFTLLEMLIAVIILGILAAIIIPQITVSTEDTKVSAVKSNLSAIRNSIEQYYVQHGNTYPGAINSTTGAGTAVASAAECQTSLLAQLTLYSQSDSKANADVSGNLTGTIYGPYMKGGALPVNPFNNLATVKCDITTTSITPTRTADNTYGWQYFMKTGLFIASDTGSSGSPSVAHTAY